MRYTIIIAIFSLIFMGCKKDTFTTAPHLEIKSVNTTVLNQNQLLTFTFNFTDLQGDIDSLFLQKINPHCSLSNYRDSLLLPAFPPSRKQQGQIFLTYGYRVDGYPSIGEPQCNFNDTCYFRFVLKDKGQNKSDTVNSQSIVIIK